MKKEVLFLLSFLFLSLTGYLHAQNSPLSDRSSQLSGRVTLEGWVLARSDQTALDHVQVSLLSFSGAPVATSTTDSDGKFYFYFLTEGTYTLSVHPPSEFEPQTVQIEARGTALRDIRIYLRRRRDPALSAGGGVAPAWAFNIPPEAEKKYKKGIELINKGKPDKAKRPLQEALDLYPQYAAAQSALGLAHLALSETKQAEAAFRGALETDRNLAQACLGLGTLLSRQKDYPEAEELLLHGRTLRPDDWKVYYELGQLYLHTKNFTAAESNLSQAIELHQQYPRSYLLLINALAQQDKLAETLRIMEDYLARFPKDSFASQVRRKRDALKQHLVSQTP